MKKLIGVFILFIPFNTNAQFKYSLKFEPIGFNKENGIFKTFELYDIQLSVKSDDKDFFFEVQPGIILNSFIPHLDFYIGGQYKIFFLKGGVLYYFDISSDGNSGPSVQTGFLPGIGIGAFITKEIFLEFLFNTAFISIGAGIEL